MTHGNRIASYSGIDARTGVDLVAPGFFAASILLLLVSRSMLDRAGYGFTVALLLIAVAGLRLLTLRTLSKQLVLFLVIAACIIGWGYLNAVLIHWEPIYSSRGVVRYGCYLAAFLIAYYSRVTVRQIYQAYGFVILVQVSVTIFERIALSETRPDGTLLNANHISYLLIPYAALTLICYRDHIRTLLIMVFSVFIGGLGGVVSLLVLVGGYVLYRGGTRLKLATVLLAPMVLSVMVVALEDRIEEQSDITTVATRLEQGRAGGGGSLVWRVVTWKMMLEELQDANGLAIGRGLDYASLASPYFLTASPIEPHNDYLRILLEFGVIGLVVYLVIYFLATKKFIADGRWNTVSMALGWTMVALGIGQLVGNIVVQSTLWWFFFALAGANSGTNAVRYALLRAEEKS